MHAEGNNLVIRPHPFSMDHGVRPVRAGQTIEQMLLEATEGEPIALTVRVEIGGYEVPRALWSKVRPKPGTAIHVTRMPAGSDSAKKWLRTIMLIVVMAVAWYVGAPVAAGGLGYGAVASAGVYMVGSLIVNALVPPPQPKLGGGGLGDAGRLNMLTGSQNQVAPYGPIPLVLGECRVFPPHAAMPYSESMGTVSYQRLMFDLGHGDVEVSDIRIGDSPLSAYEGVEYEVTTTPTLYTSDVNEVSVSAQLNDNDVVTRTTSPNVDEISLDIVFPQGLFGMDKKGRMVSATANITVEYRPVGGSTWTPVPGPGTVSGGVETRTSTLQFFGVGLPLQVKSPDRKPFIASYAWGVTPGQYEVRITRGATNWGSSESNSRIGDAQWSVLRSIRKTNPSTTGTKKLCMRIKASEQLNGPLQTLSCLVRQKIPVYNRATQAWSVPQVNYNPAWVVYWLLTTCPAVGVRVPPSRIDLNSFADFADFCTANGFETRGVLDTRVTARQLIDDILACALGSLSVRDGKYCIVFDTGSTLPVAVFTPLDTRNFSVQRVFTRIPHALRVRFKNPQADWQQDEVVVVDDGYSWRGKDARGNPSSAPEPTEFEVIELRMAANAFQAWRVARHHFAQAKFRPNVYSFETDIANIACTRGDLIHVAHDVTEWGTGWGRIKSLSGTTMVLDERVTLEAGKSYSARIRKQDGTSVVVGVSPVVRNLLTRTQEASHSAWVKVRATVSGDVAIAPDGTQTADKVTASTATGTHYVDTPTYMPADNARLSASVYVRQVEGSSTDIVAVHLYHKGGGAAAINFRFSTQSIVSSSAAGTGATFRVESAGGGWFRIMIENMDARTGATAPRVRVWPANAAGGFSYTGTGNESVYVWGAQLEVGSTATEYQRVDATVVGSPFTGDDAFTLASAPSGVNVDDVVVIGETTRETTPLIVTGIYPQPDLGARITAVEYDSRVAPYWANPPASIVSEISGTAYLEPPPEPQIIVVISDQRNDEPDDGGTTRPGAGVVIRPPSYPIRPPSYPIRPPGDRYHLL